MPQYLVAIHHPDDFDPDRLWSKPATRTAGR